MEYIGFGKDDVEYDEEPEDGLRETETVPEGTEKNPRNAAFCQREMLSAFPESIAER